MVKTIIVIIRVTNTEKIIMGLIKLGEDYFSVPVGIFSFATILGLCYGPEVDITVPWSMGCFSVTRFLFQSNINIFCELKLFPILVQPDPTQIFQMR